VWNLWNWGSYVRLSRALGVSIQVPWFSHNLPPCIPRIILLVMIKNMMKFWTCASVKTIHKQWDKHGSFKDNNARPVLMTISKSSILFFYVLSVIEWAHGPNGMRFLFRTRFNLRSLNFISSLFAYTWNFTKLNGDSFNSLSIITGSTKFENWKKKKKNTQPKQLEIILKRYTSPFLASVSV
jgi:hypothetical protein